MWTFHGLLLLTFGLLVWRAAGLAWAAGALGFGALEPTLMAHAPVAMTDLPLALTLGIAAVGGSHLSSLPGAGGGLRVFGLTLGLALGAKHSALPGLIGLGATGGIAAIASGWRGGAARHHLSG